jgi:hypothetical protein
MKSIVFLTGLLFSVVSHSQLIPMASYTLTQKQAVSSGSSIVVMFPKPEVYDPSSTQVKGHEFKAPVSGLYKIESAITLSGGTANTNYWLYITKGGVIVRGQYFTFPNALNRTLNFVTDVYIKANESINLIMYNPGAACNFEEYSHMMVSRHTSR